MEQKRYVEILEKIQNGVPVARACRDRSERSRFYEEKKRRKKKYSAPINVSFAQKEEEKFFVPKIDENREYSKKDVEKILMMGIVENARTDSKWGSIALRFLEAVDPKYQKKDGVALNENIISELWEKWAGDKNADRDQVDKKDDRKQA